jgi:hypothetical protein
MARFKSTTFGNISGKHGTAVAAVRKDGMCILKVYREASNPNTAGQQKQRGKFGFAMKELNCMRRVFTEVYDSQYGINKAVSLAMKTCVEGEFPDFNMNYSKLEIASGTLEMAMGIKCVRVEENVLQIQWDTNTYNSDSPTDHVNIVVLYQTIRQVDFKPGICTRDAGSIQITTIKDTPANQMHVWVYITSATGSKISQSAYLVIE